MPAPGSPIVLDGSHGEGGGALLRTALSLSALTQQPTRIDYVRGGTPYAGVDSEDLALIRGLGKSCEAEVIGANLGASTLSFLPTRHPRALKESLDPPDPVEGRFPNVPVVLHALAPVLARTGAYSHVSLTGETYGHHSLGFDYFQQVTCVALGKLGLFAAPDQELAGFGRDAAGRISVDIEPSALQGLDWSARGKLKGCFATIASAEMPVSIAERGIAHLAALAARARVPLETQMIRVDSRSPGIFVTLWAECERGMGGATAMGRRGTRIETLCQAVFGDLTRFLEGDATVDAYLADQLLVAACLAEGETTLKVDEITERLTTMVWVIKQFLPIRITIRGSQGDPGSIAIRP